MQKSLQETLDYGWKTYKSIAKASRENKKQIEKWQVAIFYLTISAAIVGGAAGYLQKVPIPKVLPFFEDALYHLAVNFKRFLFNNHLVNENFSLITTIGKWLGFLAAVILGVVSYFSSRILSNDKNQVWQNMRSVAEAIKSKCFLFATGKAEYLNLNDKDRTLLFLKQVEEYFNSLQNVVVMDTNETLKYPPVPMNMDDYMELRFNNQYEFYKKEIAILYAKVNRYEKVTLALGLVSALLSIVATYFDVAVLITLFTAITSTVSSYYTMKKSREILLRYSSTNKQLEILKEKYIAEIIDADTFVIEAERTLNTENSAWMNILTSQ